MAVELPDAPEPVADAVLLPECDALALPDALPDAWAEPEAEADALPTGEVTDALAAPDVSVAVADSEAEPDSVSVSDADADSVAEPVTETSVGGETEGRKVSATATVTAGNRRPGTGAWTSTDDMDVGWTEGEARCTRT